MEIIWSYQRKRPAKYVKKTYPKYVSFGGDSVRKRNGLMLMTKELANEFVNNNELFGGNGYRVFVGYNADTKEIIIAPNETDGDIKITKSSKKHKLIALGKFLHFVGFNKEDMPYGRYEAEVDKSGHLIVYLSKPLYEDEQSKKAKYFNRG